MPSGFGRESEALRLPHIGSFGAAVKCPALERLTRLGVLLPDNQTEDNDMSRYMLAAVLALGTATAALAEEGVNVKAPGVEVKTPGPDLNIKVDASTKPTDAWIGRAVYSSDGKHLGEVAALSQDQFYADIGGFLGIGETRVLLSGDQIDSVKDDRIVLKLSEAEAKALPASDAKAVAPQ
jgi:hypothetical protein